MNRTIQFSTGRMALVLTLSLLGGSMGYSADGKLQFNRDVRPILAENCLSCHGPDSASRKADLRLDHRDVAVERKTIVPGDHSKSELVQRIDSKDPDAVMPPAATKKELTLEQKTILKRWIDEGAEYQPHWSLIAPTRPDVPPVKDQAWVKNPLDAFILARLESLGLHPAPEADRRTLARRLSLDLIGLPPAPETVDQFVADSSPNAYEKFVDKLLDSKHWGEHRGRYWLDASRFADTHGIHIDNYREMWSYRDNVIAAFNANIPFDRFTIEQLAGDLLPGRTLDQQIASGFNRCNITTSEGGAIDEEYLVLYNRDRTETMSVVWMGLSAGCAVCHSHKFDPISQKEFYEMAAFFNNTTQKAMDGNVKDTPPIVVVPTEQDRIRWNALVPEIDAAKAAVEARRREARPLYDEWMKTATPAVLGDAMPTKDLSLQVALNEGEGKKTKVVIDGQPGEADLSDAATWIDGVSTKAIQSQGLSASFPEAGDFEKDEGFTCAAWVKLQANDSSGSLAARMNIGPAFRGWDFWVQGRRVGMHLVHNWPDDALKAISKAQVKGNEWTHVAVTYDGSGKAAGLKIYFNGKPQDMNVEVDKLKNTIKSEVSLTIGQRTGGSPMSGAGLQDLRIYKRKLAPNEVESLAQASKLEAILAKAFDQRSDAEKNDLYQWWLGHDDGPFKELSGKVAALEQEQNTIKARGTIAHVMNEKADEPMAYILFRGEYDKRRDQVKPNTPAALPAFPSEGPKNRLSLAQWLLEPHHPLTARVTVNRFWQEVFGTGIVRTSGDFGVMGELPANQELLDWLAIEFREGTPHLKWPFESAGPVQPWDMKRFFRLLVTSSTYRQAAISTREKLEKDPQNRFLSRGPRFRMDAEMIRDYALAVSGLLVEKIGGPSVKPYQPDGVWEAVAMIGSNTRDYKRDKGENLYRRSMYTFWKRSAPPASMEIFNATARETCTVRRERTNTPLQALVTLNDVQFVEAARNLAQSILKDQAPENTSETGRLNLMAKRLLARPFRSEELPIVQKSLAELTSYYQSAPEDAARLVAEGESKADPAIPAGTLAAWTMLANEVMNLDEVLNK